MHIFLLASCVVSIADEWHNDLEKILKDKKKKTIILFRTNRQKYFKPSDKINNRLEAS